MPKFIKSLIILGLIGSVIGFYFYTATLNKNVDETNKYYTNSLYLSSQRVYNDGLNDNQKEIYDLLLELMKARTEEYTADVVELNCDGVIEVCTSNLTAAFKALIIDHPELINASGISWKYAPDKKSVTLKLKYATVIKSIDYVGEAAINTILEKIKEETKDMTDSEKILYVYNWIGDHAEYDDVFKISSKNQSAYNAMVLGKAVCAGFAKSANLIFQSIGIESYSITGHSHMWNIVKLDDKYYYFDSTVAACRKKDDPGYYDGLKQSVMNDYGVEYKSWYSNLNISTFDMPFVSNIG